MVLPVALLLFAVSAWLAVRQGQRLAPWFLGAGAGSSSRQDPSSALAGSRRIPASTCSSPRYRA